jgi:ribosomal protein S18 acetylase RimI-like enzyme
MTVHETTLAALDFAAIGAAFTTVYAGYPRPFAMDADAARQHIARYDIDVAHSPLWLDDAGAVVALAALGVRGTEGWVGGFGVAPAWRGQGLGHRLITRVLEVGAAVGLRTLRLEVLTINPPAIRTYERAGFAQVRDLRIFASPDDGTCSTANDDAVRAIEPVDALRARDQITAVRPAWSRMPESVGRLDGLAGLALGMGAAPRAYLLYRASPERIFIADIAVPAADAVPALLGALTARFPGRSFSLNNEPEESAVCAGLDRLGWTEPIRQHEMIYRYP